MKGGNVQKNCPVFVIYKDNNTGLFATQRQVNAKLSYFKKLVYIRNNDLFENLINSQRKPDYRCLAYTELGEDPKILFDGKDPHKIYQDNSVKYTSDYLCKDLIHNQNQIVKLWLKEYNNNQPRKYPKLKFEDVKVDLAEMFSQISDLDQKYTKSKNILLFLDTFIKNNLFDDQVIEQDHPDNFRQDNMNKESDLHSKNCDNVQVLSHKGDHERMDGQGREITSAHDRSLTHSNELSISSMCTKLDESGQSKAIGIGRNNLELDQSNLQNQSFNSFESETNSSSSNKTMKCKYSIKDKTSTHGMPDKVSKKSPTPIKKRDDKCLGKTNEDNESKELASQQNIINELEANNKNYLKACMIKSFEKINKLVLRYKKSGAQKSKNNKEKVDSGMPEEKKDSNKILKKKKKISNCKIRIDAIKSIHHKLAIKIIEGSTVDYSELIEKHGSCHLESKEKPINNS